MEPIGLIAGDGALPSEVAQAAMWAGRSIFVIRLEGFAHDALAVLPGSDRNIGEIGGAMKALRSAGCRCLCFAGHVGGADFSGLRLDERGREALPRALLAAGQGDAALLSCMIAEFEADGFEVVGAHELAPELVLEGGCSTRLAPAEADDADIRKAMSVARAIGALDVGQAAVCRAGRVLAVEAQEGTDAMLRRAGSLVGEPAAAAAERRGVLAKVPKPRQDRRIDLPVIGPETVRRAGAAGLAGIVGEAGAVLLVRRAEALALADALGLFIIGREGEQRRPLNRSPPTPRRSYCWSPSSPPPTPSARD